MNLNELITKLKYLQDKGLGELPVKLSEGNTCEVVTIEETFLKKGNFNIRLDDWGETRDEESIIKKYLETKN